MAKARYKGENKGRTEVVVNWCGNHLSGVWETSMAKTKCYVNFAAMRKSN